MLILFFRSRRVEHSETFDKTIINSKMPSTTPMFTHIPEFVEDSEDGGHLIYHSHDLSWLYICKACTNKYKEITIDDDNVKYKEGNDLNGLRTAATKILGVIEGSKITNSTTNDSVYSPDFKIICKNSSVLLNGVCGGAGSEKWEKLRSGTISINEFKQQFTNKMNDFISIKSGKIRDVIEKFQKRHDTPEEGGAASRMDNINAWYMEDDFDESHFVNVITHGDGRTHATPFWREFHGNTDLTSPLQKPYRILPRSDNHGGTLIRNTHTHPVAFFGS